MTELYGGLTFGSHWIFFGSLGAGYMCGMVGWWIVEVIMMENVQLQAKRCCNIIKKR